MTLKAKASTIKAASQVVASWHRHHKAPRGGLWAVAAICEETNELCGVAIVGRPVARLLDDGATAEITRCATNETKNACSFLYAACTRAPLPLGYRKIQTYILESEKGSSLKALKELGWREVAKTSGGSWDRGDRKRTDKHPTEPKTRWECSL